MNRMQLWQYRIIRMESIDLMMKLMKQSMRKTAVMEIQRPIVWKRKIHKCNEWFALEATSLLYISSVKSFNYLVHKHFYYDFVMKCIWIFSSPFSFDIIFIQHFFCLSSHGQDPGIALTTHQPQGPPLNCRTCWSALANWPTGTSTLKHGSTSLRWESDVKEADST